MTLEAGNPVLGLAAVFVRWWGLTLTSISFVAGRLSRCRACESLERGFIEGDEKRCWALEVVLGAVCFFVVSASRGGCLPILLVLSGRVAMVASVPRGGCFALVDGRGDCGALVVSVLRVGL